MAHRSIATLAALTLAAVTLTMTAGPAHAAGANPAWKIEVILYKNTDVTYTDAAGASHHFVGSLVPAEVSRAISDATQFVNTDIPALSSGNQRPSLSVKTIDTALSNLGPDVDGGWTPNPSTTASDQDPGFDSYIVLWQSFGWDFTAAHSDNIAHDGGLTWPMGSAPTFSSIPVPYMGTDTNPQRNTLKHEWGHAILGYYDAVGAAPKPAVDNHHPETSVNCHTGQGYVLVDENDLNLVPNSIFNDTSGFTHDYYSGSTANAGDPTQCLGIGPATWATGGPVTKPVGSPDLVVTSFGWSPTAPTTGVGVTFTATIKNQGTAATPAGTKHGVAFLVDGTSIAYSDTDTASLAPGASITLTANGSNAGGATWPATRGKHTALAWVDDVNRIAESNESNNKSASKALDVYSPTAPSSVTISAGTVRSGSVSSLAKADNINYQINSTTASIRTTTWSGTIPNVPNSTPGLQVTYKGANSVNASETLSIWNYTTNAWVTMKTSTVGTTPSTTTVIPSGTSADYVSGATGSGSVKIQVKHTSTSSSFYTSNDLLSVGYL